MVSSSSGSEAAAASSGLGGNWNRLQMRVVSVWKPAGMARMAGEPNRFSACRKAISAPASKRRQGKRHGDAARGLPGLRAQHGRRVLELARHAVERVGHQDEDVGKGVAGDDEDQAGQVVDVEQRLVGRHAGERAPELVQQARVGRGQHLPGDGADEGRRHQRGHHQRAHGAADRHVGARHQPAQRRRDRAADRAHRERR